jgi:16S rRNA (guanine(527)-N(7))-methyltransferase RsmG
MELPDKLKRYMDLLLEYNQKVNLVSRKISDNHLVQLINESLMLRQFTNDGHLVDAGSGNGILGIPLAIMQRDREITLVETMRKKILFLQEVKEKMGLVNVEIQGISIEEYILGKFKKRNELKTIISRGFPGFDIFCHWIKKRKISEAVIITSENKIKKNQKALEFVTKKIYNIPWREHLKILKMAYKEFNNGDMKT